MFHDFWRVIGDLIAGGLVIATFLAKLLPPMAAFLSVAWYATLLYDRHIKKKKNETKAD